MSNPLITAIFVIGAAAYLMYSYFTTQEQYHGTSHGQTREWQYEPPPQVPIRTNSTNRNRKNKPHRRRFVNSDEDVCVICQDKMNGDSNNVILSCTHIFHFKCINQWFKEDQSCPVCRSKISL